MTNKTLPVKQNHLIEYMSPYRIKYFAKRSDAFPDPLLHSLISCVHVSHFYTKFISSSKLLEVGIILSVCFVF